MSYDQSPYEPPAPTPAPPSAEPPKPASSLTTVFLVAAILIVVGAGLYTIVRGHSSSEPASGVNAMHGGASSGMGSGNMAADSDSSGPAVIRFVKDPEPAPDIEGRDILGQTVSIAAAKGKVVLVNFWATWCPPCREEIPEMIALQNKYKDRLQIIGISEDEDGPQKVQRFAQQKGMNYPILMSTEQMISSYGGVPALPTTFMIDPQGRVVLKHAGLKDMDTYDREIRSLLGMPVDARVETFVDQGEVFLKNAANATELPGVDLSSLTPAQKQVALRRLNAEPCTCGCKLTLAECRVNDTTCPVSQGLAQDVVKQVHDGKNAPRAPSQTNGATQPKPVAQSPSGSAPQKPV